MTMPPSSSSKPASELDVSRGLPVSTGSLPEESETTEPVPPTPPSKQEPALSPPEVPAEGDVDTVRNDTDDLASVIVDHPAPGDTDPEDLPDLSTSELDAVQRRVLKELKKAGDAEAKMHRLAVLLDVYPVDAVLGAVPWIGDGVVTTLALIYTLRHSYKIGLGLKRTTKIAGFHLADFLAGSLADFGGPVVAGLVDYFIKPNEFAAGEFSKKLEELLEKARNEGVPEEEIQAVLRDSRELKKLWEQRAEPVRKAKKASLEKLLGGKKKGEAKNTEATPDKQAVGH